MKFWTKDHKIKIRYKEGNRYRKYNPDVLVEFHDGRKFLEEVKGKVWDRMNFVRKNIAALSWCQVKGMEFRIIYEAGLETVG